MQFFFSKYKFCSGQLFLSQDCAYLAERLLFFSMVKLEYVTILLSKIFKNSFKIHFANVKLFFFSKEKFCPGQLFILARLCLIGYELCFFLIFPASIMFEYFKALCHSSTRQNFHIRYRFCMIMRT